MTRVLPAPDRPARFRGVHLLGVRSRLNYAPTLDGLIEQALREVVKPAGC
jgi:hypothetical protein